MKKFILGFLSSFFLFFYLLPFEAKAETFQCSFDGTNCNKAASSYCTDYLDSDLVAFCITKNSSNCDGTYNCDVLSPPTSTPVPNTPTSTPHTISRTPTPRPRVTVSVSPRPPKNTQPTPLPTSPYTCEGTCMTETSCHKKARGSLNGTCPIAEICCELLTTPLPSGTTPIPTPQITPFYAPGMIDHTTRCWFTEWGKEYHPLRPYAASPCAGHLIPIKHKEAPQNRNYPYLFQSYSCGKSASPGGIIVAPGVIKITDVLERFPPLNNNLLCFDWIHNLNSPSLPPECKYFKQAVENANHMSYPVLCNDFSGSAPNVCFLAKIVFNVVFDYTDSNFPILGNTKDRIMSDRQKLNNYLSWYLNGAILQSENIPLNTNKATDNDRIINFSGPVLKLLSKESIVTYRNTLKKYLTSDVHNYQTSEGTHMSGVNADSTKARTLKGALESTYMEFATEEDVMSEVQPSLIQDDQPTSPEIDGKIIAAILHFGEAESRIFFPHLKNTVTLSEYLMSTYKPAVTPINPNPTDAAKERRELASQRFQVYQGLDRVWWNGGWYNMNEGDQTVVYLEYFEDKAGIPEPAKFDSKYISRNTEVFPFNKPPEPLFTDYSTRFPTVNDQHCDITDTVTNSGDSLVGGKIYSTFTLWQAFKYVPFGLIMFPSGGYSDICQNFGLSPNGTPQCKNWGGYPPYGCSALEGGVCSFGNPSTTSDDTCCYGECHVLSDCEMAGYSCRRNSSNCDFGVGLSCGLDGGQCCGINGVTPVPNQPKCSNWPEKDLKTKGRIAIYLKVPFVEKLYQLLVERGDSLLRRFLPYGGTNYAQLVASQTIPTPTLSQANCCNGPTSSCSTITDQASCQNAAPIGCTWNPACKPEPTPICCNGPMTNCNFIHDQASCQNAAPIGCTWNPACNPPTPIPTPDFLKTGIDAIPGEGGALYTSSPDEKNGADVKDPYMTAGFGGAPALYYPRIGSLFEYLLGAGKDPLNLQCILRPQGFCEIEKEDGMCIPTDENVNAAIAKIAAKYGMQESMLRAIFEIESFQIASGAVAPEDWKCEPNAAGSSALGITQILQGTYEQVTCPNEEYANGSDMGVCPSEGSRLSRCDIEDAFELTARVLLSFVGAWNSATCTPTRTVDWTDFKNIYKATNHYYGVCTGNVLTYKATFHLLGPKRPTDNATYGDNYADLIVNMMGLINSVSDYPPQCSAPYW